MLRADTPHNTGLLRSALRANALFSAVSGFAAVLAAGPLAERFGLPDAPFLWVPGTLLLLFAVQVWVVARRPAPPPALVRVITALDVAWVVGSAAVLLFGVGELTRSGQWTVGIVADMVLVFAILQLVGLRRATPA